MELIVLTGIGVILGILNLLVLFIVNSKIDELQKKVESEAGYRRKIMEMLDVLIKKSKINYN
jgi:hypothetical protein